MGFEPEIIGRDPAQAIAEGRVKDRVPRPLFVLWYDPTDWQVLADGELRPSISHVSLAPGAGADPNGDFTAERNRRLKRGEIEIPLDVLGPGKGYVAKYTNMRGQSVHRSVFLQKYESEGVTKWRPDLVAIGRFIAYLKRRGIIKPPTPSVISGLIGKTERLRDRLANVQPVDRADAVSRWTDKMAMFGRQLDSLRRELEQSIELYGEEVSVGRSLLDNLGSMFDDDEEAEDAPVVTPAKPKAEKPSKPVESK